jgi:hypothetical protein
MDMVQASGIPALRSFCYSVTAQKQLLEARHFLSPRLGALLNSMQIWVDGLQNGPNRATQPSKQDVLDVLGTLKPKVSLISGLLANAI